MSHKMHDAAGNPTADSPSYTEDSAVRGNLTEGVPTAPPHPIRAAESSPQQQAALAHLQEAARPAFLAALAEHGTIRQAALAAGVARSTATKWLREDEMLAHAAREAKDEYAESIEDLLTDVIRRPEQYDRALVRPSWMTAILFRLKKERPEYRESAPAVNVAVQVNVEDRLTPEQRQRIAESLYEADS